MSIAQAGVYLPFKQLLQGSGMNIVETATSITIGTTGAGPGGGDMLQSVYATNGQHGIVDEALLAKGLAPGATVPFATQAGAVPWGGITGTPTTFPSSWSQITGIPSSFPTTWAQIANIPATFPPAPHEPTHMPGGSDALPLAGTTSPGLLAQLSGRITDYVGGDNTCHPLPASISTPDGDASPPATPSAFDDEFTSATLNTKWSISGTKALVTATLVPPTTPNFLQLAYQYGATGTITLRATETLTGIVAGFGFQVRLRFVLAPYGSAATLSSYFGNAGFGLMSGTRSIAVFVSIQAYTDSAGNEYYYAFFTIGRGANMVGFVDLAMACGGGDLRLKIWNDVSGGTPGNLSIAASTDAINWVTIYTEAFSNGGSLNGLFPTSLILDLDSGGSATGGQSSAMGAFDYVRKVS